MQLDTVGLFINIYMKFNRLFNKIIKEDNTAGGGDVFGPGSVTTELPGEYDPGAARLAYPMFMTTRNGLSKKRKRKKKRKN